jgi:hypothetical protein
LRTSRSSVTRVAVALGATFTLGLGMVASFAPGAGLASSHREAPLLAGDPRVDTTDVYAFVSPDDRSTVTMISNWYPFETPAGGPNFYSFQAGVRYEFRVDNDGDAGADQIWRLVFTNHYRNLDTFLYNTGAVNNLTDPTLNFYQTFTLTEISGGHTTTLVNEAIAAPSDVGDASMPNYAQLRQQATYTFPLESGSSGKIYVGQADDPFFLDLRVFDLLYGANFGEVGNDTLSGSNVQTIALQLPKKALALNGQPGSNPIIGMWATSWRQSTRVQTAQGTESFSGKWIEVSRLGAPLVNEVVVPLRYKDLWNGSLPKDDGQFLPYVLDPEVPHLIDAIYGLPVPDCDGDPSNGIDRSCDLVPVFLTGLAGLNQPPNVVASEELRLNMSIPPCELGNCRQYSPLGVIAGDNAGFPNGRRLADDTIDIALQVVEGCLIDSSCGPSNGLGDGVNTNDVAFGSSFPYVALPHSGSAT